MGMDVYGTKPRTETGGYFRNNVWWWHPLWDYCQTVAPELCADIYGHSNDGDGLDEEGSLELARILDQAIKSGHTAQYEHAYREAMGNLPRHTCEWCGGTGVRTDKIGQEMNMPTRELEPEVAILVGRTHGWCNGCGGEGLCDDHRTHYPFSTENVRAFADFLANCGGFRIC